MRSITKFIIALFLTSLSYYSTARPIKIRKIKKMLKESEVLAKYFVGFALYDLKDRKMLVEQNADKYFTPASNTKLFTFYAGLKLLKDSVPGLQYRIKGDSLLFWGTGDPSLLHPDFLVQPIIQKLQASGKKLFLVGGRYTGNFYGWGWPYGDYNEYYQVEKSELPLYGNVIRFSGSGGQLKSIPSQSLIKTNVYLQPDASLKSYYIQRELAGNIFHIPTLPIPASFNQEIPYKITSALTDSLLKSQLSNYSGRLNYRSPTNAKTWYSFPSDTIFKHMLLPSDNFIAEQLLLTYAAENNLNFSTDVAISHAIKTHMQDLPDKPQWVDGSGLSRHNLVTPRSIVKLCEKIYDEVNDEKRLFNLLPNGGKTGTLRNLFKSEPKPFVFAKTGNLSNNSNISGYLVTKNGKRLIFSFMNNNFTAPTATIRAEMDRVLTAIYINN